VKTAISKVAFLLVLTLTFCLIPAGKAEAAFPPSLDRNKLGSAKPLNAFLDLGPAQKSVRLNGVVTNDALSDDKLAEIIEQALAEMGADANDFELWHKQIQKLEKQPLSKEDYEKIRDNFYDTFGVVPAPYIGIGTSVAQFLDQLMRKDLGGATVTAGEPVVTEMIEHFGNEHGYWEGKAMKALGTAYGWAKFFKMLNSQREADNKRWAEYAAAFEAKYKINTFYDLCNKLIADYMAEASKSSGKTYYIRFDDVKSAPQYFTLFGGQFKETWTLSMALKQVKPYRDEGGTSGRYEGPFMLVIDYDLTGLMDRIRYMGWLGDALRAAEDVLQAEFVINVGNPGRMDVQRTITGNATVDFDPLSFSGNDTRISLNTDSNEKQVHVSDIQASAQGLGLGGFLVLILDFEITADEEYFHIQNTNRDIYSNIQEAQDAMTGMAQMLNFTGPLEWEGNIWERSDDLNPRLKISMFR